MGRWATISRRCQNGYAQPPARDFQGWPADLPWMKNQQHVAFLHFDGLVAHALGQEAFKIRIDGAVFGRNGIETWFRPPGRLDTSACQLNLLKRFLDRIGELSRCFRQVACEIAAQSFVGLTARTGNSIAENALIA
jgi:hypothetical protein